MTRQKVYLHTVRNNMTLLSTHNYQNWSYIVPIPKIKDCRTKAMSCGDFRGIAICPLLSKVYEHCLLWQLQTFIKSEDNQFGFKKGVGCSHAIYTTRHIVDRWFPRALQPISVL